MRLGAVGNEVLLIISRYYLPGRWRVRSDSPREALWTARPYLRQIKRLGALHAFPARGRDTSVLRPKPARRYCTFAADQNRWKSMRTSSTVIAPLLTAALAAVSTRVRAASVSSGSRASR